MMASLITTNKGHQKMNKIMVIFFYIFLPNEYILLRLQATTRYKMTLRLKCQPIKVKIVLKSYSKGEKMKVSPPAWRRQQQWGRQASSGPNFYLALPFLKSCFFPLGFSLSLLLLWKAFCPPIHPPTPLLCSPLDKLCLLHGWQK